MEKRLLVAVTLSIIVLLTYQVILTKVNPPKAGPKVEEPAPLPPVQQKEITQKEAVKVMLPGSAAIRVIQGDRYKLDITDEGGLITRVTIKDPMGQDLYLVDNATYDSGILSMKGSGAFSNLSSEKFALNPAAKTVSLENNILRVEKNIGFLKDTYGMEAFVKITNLSGGVQASLFDIAAVSNISKKEMYESRFVQLDIYYKDGKTKIIKGPNLLNYNRIYKNDIDWIALKNKYYAIIARPKFIPKGIFTKGVAGEPVAGFIVEDENVSPGETRSYNINFYIGPMELRELEKVDRDFTKVLDFGSFGFLTGFFTGISLVLLSILQFLNSIFHNYGVSILFLTLLTSLFLYPLTFKSLKSMQKLQELQPHIEKIRSEHKANPAKLNKEIMELYRRYNVNPMGGCLPMLLQMPVFIALYNTLSRSVELKGAGFLWIKDLSMPDAFLRLNFSLPIIGNAINLLPILMMGAMILQQKISQVKGVSSQTEQQRMMAFLMPLLFGFLFYSLPSGLVLYWLTNTVITSVSQLALFRKAA